MKKRNFPPLFAAPLILASGPALAQTRQYSDWGFDHMMNWGGGWGGMILGPIMMMVILALVVAVVIAVLRWFGVIDPVRGTAVDDESALDILEKRFARGEIDEAEFTSRKSALNH
jgi:putative membrane protein